MCSLLPLGPLWLYFSCLGSTMASFNPMARARLQAFQGVPCLENASLLCSKSASFVGLTTQVWKNAPVLKKIAAKRAHGPIFGPRGPDPPHIKNNHAAPLGYPPTLRSRVTACETLSSLSSSLVHYLHCLRHQALHPKKLLWDVAWPSIRSTYLPLGSKVLPEEPQGAF